MESACSKPASRTLPDKPVQARRVDRSLSVADRLTKDQRKQCAVAVGCSGSLRHAGESCVDGFLPKLGDDLPNSDFDASEVQVMLLAEHEDVVTKRLETNRSVAHILWHLDAFANLVLALDEKLARRLVCANLLTLQDTINPEANPPDVAASIALPNAPYSFRFPGINDPSENQNSKVLPEVSPALSSMKKPLGLRSFGLSKPFIFNVL